MKKIIALGAGIAAHLFYLTSPIHEFGHWFFGVLVGVKGHIGWRSFSFTGPVSHSHNIILSWGGIWFETLFFLIIAMLFRNKKPYLSTFSGGVSLAAFISAAWATDLIYIGDIGLMAWYTIGFAVLLLVIIKAVKRLRTG